MWLILCSLVIEFLRCYLSAIGIGELTIPKIHSYTDCLYFLVLSYHLYASISCFVFRSQSYFRTLRYKTHTYLELDGISVSHRFLSHTRLIPLFPCTDIVLSAVGYHRRFFDCHGYWLSHHMGNVLLSLENTGSGFKVLFLIYYLIYTDWNHS